MDLKNKQEKCKYPGFWNFLEDTVPVFFSNYFPFPFLFCHSFSYSDISVAGIFSKVRGTITYMGHCGYQWALVWCLKELWSWSNIGIEISMLSVKEVIFVALMKTFPALISVVVLLVCVQANTGGKQQTYGCPICRSRLWDAVCRVALLCWLGLAGSAVGALCHLCVGSLRCLWQSTTVVAGRAAWYLSWCVWRCPWLK